MGENSLAGLYRDYFEYLPGGFDDIYILHANSGEVFCFLAYLAKAFIEKNGSENPLFVATKPYHEDIIKMYFPKIRYVYYNMYLKEPRLNFVGDCVEYDDHKIYQIFSNRHFNLVNSNLGHIHYFDAMLQTLGLEKEVVSKPSPKISSKVKKDVLQIAEKIGLEADNFVIVAPEALTTALMPTSFWRNLIKQLYNKGYDVFLNVTKNTDLNCKEYNLSFSELFALASISKGIVSLKSGLTEFLSPVKSKNIVLAQKFHWSPILTAQQCLDAYSIMKLPYINNKTTFEINIEQYESENRLINYILELLEK